ncbi:MAG: hypothetical protein COZ70_02155 [Deltaproteobacteria bacterium CG_4_8_14_3_um_filter_51_11]|nr:MAG: hypothetical protein AUK25_05090 [Desulfobacteraceae bacterium CG2_30_51_40]PIP47310.1 MAG: hypothetical protein COX16_05080 [Deltaproteobacteria bacterium CG23_combo_of_CG06-09_8_20_14_all_51_20]PIW00388.1 MAG: hypothetical protein COW41_05590 [Deltaproteobacteria bacterium CG17_big_fil_post_rev_8_21_14_2_50_51_6]PIX20716.1 MAG: hypothetical protein COZ70_02155 [Deltaproteobacteria bacterium CG_4_8_14_3_um_filter_51_11]PIY25947.1 MAG: hypothetical protein COZ11_04025 [Deltaproteobacter
MNIHFKCQGAIIRGEKAGPVNEDLVFLAGCLTINFKRLPYDIAPPQATVAANRALSDGQFRVSLITCHQLEIVFLFLWAAISEPGSDSDPEIYMARNKGESLL